MIYNHFRTWTTVEPLPICTCTNQNKDDKTKEQTPTIHTRLAIRTLYVKLDPLHTVCPQLYPLSPYTTNSLANTSVFLNAMAKPTQLKPPPPPLSQRSRCNPPNVFFWHFDFFFGRVPYVQRKRVMCSPLNLYPYRLWVNFTNSF